MSSALWLALSCAVLAVLYGWLSSRSILALPAGNERMQQIAAAVQEGASGEGTHAKKGKRREGVAHERRCRVLAILDCQRWTI